MKIKRQAVQCASFSLLSPRLSFLNNMMSIKWCCLPFRRSFWNLTKIWISEETQFRSHRYYYSVVKNAKMKMQSPEGSEKMKTIDKNEEEERPPERRRNLFDPFWWCCFRRLLKVKGFCDFNYLIIINAQFPLLFLSRLILTLIFKLDSVIWRWELKRATSWTCLFLSRETTCHYNSRPES